MRAELENPFPVRGAKLRYDFFRPDTDERLPLVVFVHGGGWISGQKEDYREEAVRWASRGWGAACVSYRLAPGHPFPTPVADVQRFFLHLRQASERMGVDPERTAIFGNSAGGHLALMAALAPQALDGDEPAQRPSRVVAVCPITDITDVAFTQTPVAMGFLEQFMGAPYDENDLRWALASPVCQSLADAPPILLVHGTDDDIVPFSQSERMLECLEHAGRVVDFMPMPGEAHSFTYDAWSHIRRKAEQFLDDL